MVLVIAFLSFQASAAHRVAPRTAVRMHVSPSNENRAALERLFQMGEEVPEVPMLQAGILEDLPLWRVQWSVLVSRLPGVCAHGWIVAQAASLLNEWPNARCGSRG
jgi:hypothetical protein